jgi:hypothetical protein
MCQTCAHNRTPSLCLCHISAGVLHANRGRVPELAARPPQSACFYVVVRCHATEGQGLPADAAPRRGGLREVRARTRRGGPPGV